MRSALIAVLAVASVGLAGYAQAQGNDSSRPIGLLAAAGQVCYVQTKSGATEQTCDSLHGTTTPPCDKPGNSKCHLKGDNGPGLPCNCK